MPQAIFEITDVSSISWDVLGRIQCVYMFEGKFIIVELPKTMRTTMLHIPKWVSEAISSDEKSWTIIQLSFLHLAKTFKA